MKADIHPNYRFVVFRDINTGTEFLSRTSMPDAMIKAHEQTIKDLTDRALPLAKLAEAMAKQK